MQRLFSATIAFTWDKREQAPEEWARLTRAF
jgi:hypothetical protein